MRPDNAAMLAFAKPFTLAHDAAQKGSLIDVDVQSLKLADEHVGAEVDDKTKQGQHGAPRLRPSKPPVSRPTSEVSESCSSTSSSSSCVKFDVDSQPISCASSRISMDSTLSNRCHYRNQDEMERQAGKSTDSQASSKEQLSESETLVTGSTRLKRSQRTISHRSESSIHGGTQPPRTSRRRGASAASANSSPLTASPKPYPAPKSADRPVTVATSPSGNAIRSLPDVQTCGFFEELGASAESYIGLDDAFWTSTPAVKTLYASSDCSSLSYPRDGPTTSLAVELAEQGCDILRVNGRNLWEVEDAITSDTTHLLLSGCRDTALFDFLERVLPSVADSLLVLDVSSTGLHELPNCLHMCTRLEELNLSDNPALQASTANLEILARLGASLQLLNLDGCQLTLLPGSLMSLRNLRILSASRNQLAHLPAWLHRLQSLQRLVLADNPFQGPWASVCEEFCKPLPATLAMVPDEGPLPSTAGPVQRHAISMTSKSKKSLGTSMSSEDFEGEESVEELQEEPPSPVSPDSPQSVSSLNLDSSGGVATKPRSLRPFVRRMLSAGDLKGTLTDGAKKANASEAASKWNSIRRKIQGKSDLAHADVGKVYTEGDASASQVSLTVGSGMTSQSPFHLLPKAVRKVVRSSSSTSSSKDAESLVRHSSVGDLAGQRLRRISFLPFGSNQDAHQSFADAANAADAMNAADEDAKHRKSVRKLLQYLEDLSDLNPVQRNLNIYLNRPSPAHDSGSSAGHSSSSLQRFSDNSSASASSSVSDTFLDASESSTSLSAAVKVGSSCPPPVYKDDARRRLHVIREILSTELTYTRNLRELVDLYVMPAARSDPTTQQPCIPLQDRRQAFSNIEAILHFHSEAFAPALHEAARCALTANDDDHRDLASFHDLTIRAAEQIARTFDRHAAFFRMYTAYVNNVDTAQRCIAGWNAPHPGSQATAVLRPSTAKNGKRENLDGGSTRADNSMASNISQEVPCTAFSAKERKRLRQFLQSARQDKRHSQLSLEAYIHLPVQRIPRYRLLLEDLVRVCPPERMSSPGLIQGALDSMSSIASMMNESKRQSEMDRKLLYWQDRIRGSFPSPLVQPHRKLINNGAMTLCRIVTRVPSFNIGRHALLGEVNLLDSYEESMLLRFADAQHASPPKGEPMQAVHSQELQIFHLERQQINRRVHLILCNDITVIVDEQQSGPVDLLAVLRVTGPARIVNERILRITDPKHILYFEASSRQEAEIWRQALALTSSLSAGQS